MMSHFGDALQVTIQLQLAWPSLHFLESHRGCGVQDRGRVRRCPKGHKSLQLFRLCFHGAWKWWNWFVISHHWIILMTFLLNSLTFLSQNIDSGRDRKRSILPFICSCESREIILNWWPQWCHCNISARHSSMAKIYHGKHCSNEFKCFTSFNPHLSFSRSVMSNSLWPHGLQHTRLPCPLLSPGVCSNSCPLSQWCYPTISSSVASFSCCPQSFPASGSFPMSWLFVSSGQSIGASASASVLPVNIQDWFPLELTGLISLLTLRLSRVLPGP